MESQSEKSDETRDPSSTTHTSLGANGFSMGSEALQNHSLAQAPSRMPTKSEIVSQEFSPFDAETLIAKPFMDHETGDDKFEEGRYRAWTAN